MLFQKLKKERKITFSRKIKKKHFKKFYVSIYSSTFYLTSFKYGFLKHFFKKQSTNLNRKIVYKLLNEELGFIFSLNN